MAKFKIKICPRCKRSNIKLHAGGIDGLYECKDCEYIGPIILEEERDV